MNWSIAFSTTDTGFDLSTKLRVGFTIFEEKLFICFLGIFCFYTKKTLGQTNFEEVLEIKKDSLLSTSITP